MEHRCQKTEIYNMCSLRIIIIIHEIWIWLLFYFLLETAFSLLGWAIAMHFCFVSTTFNRFGKVLKKVLVACHNFIAFLSFAHIAAREWLTNKPNSRSSNFMHIVCAQCIDAKSSQSQFSSCRALLLKRLMHNFALHGANYRQFSCRKL